VEGHVGFLKKLGSLFSGKGGVDSDGRAIFFYVRCNSCGEKIRVRVDTYNELSQEIDDSDKVSGYVIDKEVIGNKCFRMMHLHVDFDGGKRITAKTVSNGTLISKEEFLLQE
jgi:DNA-directed RNA polymerase subunit N (RpoN/RPB10)